MELWYTEEQTNNVRFSIRCDKQIYAAESDYQRIEIFSTPEFGKILILDDRIMLTEKDEFIYHEMITHIPLSVNPNIKNVLVIGAGDGGVTAELTKYDNIEHIDLVEIDKMVVDACLEYLPDVSGKLLDKKVTIHIDDGLRYVRSCENQYDLIIVDSTDPVGPGEGLFTKEFYGSCYKALRDDGIMVYQHGSPFYDEDEVECRKMHRKVFRSFPVSRVYQAHIPTCPSGYWLFGFASKKYHPLEDFRPERFDNLNIETWYYTTNLHRGAFMLPKYVEDLLEEEENSL